MKKLVLVLALVAAFGCGKKEEDSAKTDGKGTNLFGKQSNAQGNGASCKAPVSVACALNVETGGCGEFGNLPAAGAIAGIKTGCTNQGGTVVTSCPKEGLVGSCALAVKGMTDAIQIVYVYTGTRQDIEKVCAEAKGTICN